MIKTLLFGSNGFLGSHLQSQLDGEVIGVNIRQQNWQENIPDDANVFINCIGKAHDHNGTATEHDFYFANYELVKVLFEEFLKFALLFVQKLENELIPTSFAPFFDIAVLLDK